MQISGRSKFDHWSVWPALAAVARQRSQLVQGGRFAVRRIGQLGLQELQGNPRIVARPVGRIADQLKVPSQRAELIVRIALRPELPRQPAGTPPLDGRRCEGQPRQLAREHSRVELRKVRGHDGALQQRFEVAPELGKRRRRADHGVANAVDRLSPRVDEALRMNQLHAFGNHAAMFDTQAGDLDRALASGAGGGLEVEDDEAGNEVEKGGREGRRHGERVGGAVAFRQGKWNPMDQCVSQESLLW